LNLPVGILKELNLLLSKILTRILKALLFENIDPSTKIETKSNHKFGIWPYQIEFGTPTTIGTFFFN
jgi:hypothetical protein